LSVQLQDLELLDAVRDFTLQHPHPAIAGFKAGMRDWGDRWRAVEATRLPVTEILEQVVAAGTPAAQGLLNCFLRHNPRLHWEQSYRKQDGLVPQAMLDGYAFAEILGQRGPFVSDRIRAGLAIWGPDIDYPQHRHEAVEAYVLLAGSAYFRFDDGAEQLRLADDVVYVEANRRHGLRTGAEPVVIFYLWQGGDLRQTSRFD
jgi:mannose-6-phosphate isomerase-like protein (cupin superfamily)